MSENYRGEVAFGTDPADVFWTKPNACEQFIISCFKANRGNAGDPEDEDDFSVYENEGFALADHRDTAGCYGRAESVMDFVADNLDLSTMEDTGILDAYINEEEARLIVVVTSTDDDIKEMQNWQFSPYETMEFERADRISDDEWELIYHIDGLNRNNVNEVLYECKKNTLNEGTARTRLSKELREFVSRFVRDMSGCIKEGQSPDGYYIKLADLALDTAKAVGFPYDALKWLPWILSDDCLSCDLGRLTNTIEMIQNIKR